VQPGRGGELGRGKQCRGGLGVVEVGEELGGQAHGGPDLSHMPADRSVWEQLPAGVSGWLDLIRALERLIAEPDEGPAPRRVDR
jgi:hypothetical protein